MTWPWCALGMTQRTLTDGELYDVLGRYRESMQLYAGALVRQDYGTAEHERDRAERLYELMAATLAIRTV